MAGKKSDKQNEKQDTKQSVKQDVKQDAKPVVEQNEKGDDSNPKQVKKSGGKKPKFLMYKGRPLVRSGNELYYGNMNDDYVVMLQILSTKKVGDMTVAEKVQVQLMSTDPDLRMKDRIAKKSEKIGLYNALDIGSIWLERALEE